MKDKELRKLLLEAGFLKYYCPSWNGQVELRAENCHNMADYLGMLSNLAQRIEVLEKKNKR